MMERQHPRFTFALGIGMMPIPEYVGETYTKCKRCWNYPTHVGKSTADTTKCDHC
jgi:hypothetical protein